MTASRTFDITVYASLPAEVADALGAERSAHWRIDRSHYRPTVRAIEVDGKPIAAVLTSGRPATAATKIVDLWWSSSAEDAAAALVDTVIADAATRGDAAVKWETADDVDLPLFAVERGFAPMRTPYPSAAGTLGVRGWALWTDPITHTEPGYYAQTTLFTCGSVAALVALGTREGTGGLGFSGQDDRDLEIAFWRQASNYPACEPIGLGVAVRERIGGHGRPVEISLDTDGPVLIDGFEGFERSFRAELQEESRRRAADLGIPITASRVPIEEVRDRVAAGDLALLLIDEAPMHGETGPHWILAQAAAGDTVIVEDPWISADDGETWVDTHELPILLADLDRLVAWGPEATRGVVFISRD